MTRPSLSVTRPSRCMTASPSESWAEAVLISGRRARAHTHTRARAHTHTRARTHARAQVEAVPGRGADRRQRGPPRRRREVRHPRPPRRQTQGLHRGLPGAIPPPPPNSPPPRSLCVRALCVSTRPFLSAAAAVACVCARRDATVNVRRVPCVRRRMRCVRRPCRAPDRGLCAPPPLASNPLRTHAHTRTRTLGPRSRRRRGGADGGRGSAAGGCTWTPSTRAPTPTAARRPPTHTHTMRAGAGTHARATHGGGPLPRTGVKACAGPVDRHVPGSLYAPVQRAEPARSSDGPRRIGTDPPPAPAHASGGCL